MPWRRKIQYQNGRWSLLLAVWLLYRRTQRECLARSEHSRTASITAGSLAIDAKLPWQAKKMASCSLLYINMAAPYTVRRDGSWVRPARAAACGGAVQQSAVSGSGSRAQGGELAVGTQRARFARLWSLSEISLFESGGGITIILRRLTCEPMVESAEDAVANRDGQSIRHLLS